MARGSDPLEAGPVLVTGGAGFIGSHLVARLVKERLDLHVAHRPRGDTGRLTPFAKGVTLHPVDLADAAAVEKLVKGLAPQAVFHLAGYVNATRDPDVTARCLRDNAQATMQLAHACRRADVALFVNAGTCEEYGNGAAPFKESQRESPVSPYSASKVAATHLLDAMHRTIAFPVVTVRPFLTYGPGQDNAMLVPSLIRACLTDSELALTKGDQTRELNFVADIAEGIVRIARCPKAIGRIVNLGNGVEHVIADVAARIQRLCGGTGRLKLGAVPYRPGEVMHFYSDNAVLQELIGWVPPTSLEEGLRETIAWWRTRLAATRPDAGRN